MMSPTHLTNAALFSLGVLSILCGIFVLQTAQLLSLTPGWISLLAFFSVGALWKTIEVLHQCEQMPFSQLRIVTVEYTWKFQVQEGTA